jgi:hypothetical protein
MKTRQRSERHYTLRVEGRFHERHQSAYIDFDHAMMKAEANAEHLQQRVFISTVGSDDSVAVVWPKRMWDRLEARKAELIQELAEITRLLSEEPPIRH